MSNFLSNFNIQKEEDFSEKTIPNIPIGNNNISIKRENMDIKPDSIHNSKPMLSGNQNTIHIPEGRKIKIKPSLSNKKIPNDMFSMMANAKKILVCHPSKIVTMIPKQICLSLLPFN